MDYYTLDLKSRVQCTQSLGLLFIITKEDS